MPSGCSTGLACRRVLESEVDYARVGVLEQPPPIRLGVRVYVFDRFDQPRIGDAQAPGEVVRRLDHVVVPPRLVREQCPPRMHHLSRTHRSEEVTL